MSLDDIYKKISDPKYFGPGDWIYIHQLGLDAEEDQDIDFFIKTVKKITHYLTCADCNEHGHQHIKEKDPETYRNWRDASGKRRGMFKYSVDYHNHANRNSGKKEMPYEDALALWLGVKNGACKGGCGDHEGKIESQQSSQSIPKSVSQSSQSISKSVPQSTFKTVTQSSKPVPQSAPQQGSKSVPMRPTSPIRTSSVFSSSQQPGFRFDSRSTSPQQSVQQPSVLSFGSRSTSPPQSIRQSSGLNMEQVQQPPVFGFGSRSISPPQSIQQPPILSFGSRSPERSEYEQSRRQFHPSSQILTSSPTRVSSIFSPSYVNNDYSKPQQSLYSKPDEAIILPVPQPLFTGEEVDSDSEVIEDVVNVKGKLFPIKVRTGQSIRLTNTN